MWVEEELYAHEFYSRHGMLIVKGVEDVHALHVLQFAALILCIMCMMTKGFEMKCALEITQDVLPCSLCPKHCC